MQNQPLLKLYLEKTLDVLINGDNIVEGKYIIMSSAKDILIRYVANRHLTDHLPCSSIEMIIEAGLLECYEYEPIAEGVNSPVAVFDLPGDTQRITQNFQNVKYLLNCLGEDESNNQWLSSIHDWVKAVSDFQLVNKNTGEFFQEYINRLSSIFIRKSLKTIALKYGVIPFDMDVIEIIEEINKHHPNLINMKRIKKAITREEWLKQYKGGLAELLPTNPSPPIDESLITCAGDLFPRGVFQASDASIIAQSMFSFFVSKSKDFNEDGLLPPIASKTFGCETVYVTIESNNYTRAKIAAKGEMIYTVMQTLIGYWLNTPPNDGYKIKVSGTNILKTMGRLYLHDAEGCRLSKEISLNEFAEAIVLLRGLRISVTMPSKPEIGKAGWRINDSALFDIAYQMDITGQMNFLAPDDFSHATVRDIELIYTTGEWTRYLHTRDKKYYSSIGYLHKQAFLAPDGDFAGILMKLMAIKLERHPQGDFAISNLLIESGLEDLYNKLMLKRTYDTKLAQRLYEKVMSALSSINANNIYIINYRDPDPQEWMFNPGIKKPKGWFRKWVKVVVVFQKPECLRKIKQEEKDKPKNHNVIDIKAERVEDTSPPNDLEALEARIKESGVSKRAISLYLDQSPNWLSRKLNQGNWTKKDFSNIDNAISFLSKKK